MLIVKEEAKKMVSNFLSFSKDQVPYFTCTHTNTNNQISVQNVFTYLITVAETASRIFTENQNHNILPIIFFPFHGA